MNKYAITGLVWLLSLSGAVFYTWDYTTAKQAEAQLEAVNTAIKQERIRQAGVDKIEQKLYEDLRGVNDALNIQLNKLRQRAARMPTAARAECKGATGAELSGRDAAAFARLGARAEQCRTGLAACYAYADSLQEK